ncbi:C-glycoside deglycosidase beta subunit domain-containing protein [Arthrobacter ramosus]|uniref:C-deglycosylation enzyme beta subunit n=1 Tax=Arthrobacter ramosus TaxID=1672 RepID=A0ABV5XY04_ARTRM|nr:DUF6379 domain-containing protein [Arthrobacter ramosus]
MESMLQTALRDDALASTSEGFELRIGLPWIRSMPLSSVSSLELVIDDEPMPPTALSALLGERRVPASSLQAESGWWFVQDRLVIAGQRRLGPGEHTVSAGFWLLVPYLQAGPGSPLILPFHLESRLQLDHAHVPSVSCDVA